MKNSHNTPKIDWTKIDLSNPFPVTTEIITDEEAGTITFLPDSKPTITHVTYYMPDGDTVTLLTEEGEKARRQAEYEQGGTKFSGNQP